MFGANLISCYPERFDFCHETRAFNFFQKKCSWGRREGRNHIELKEDQEVSRILRLLSSPPLTPNIRASQRSFKYMCEGCSERTREEEEEGCGNSRRETEKENCKKKKADTFFFCWSQISRVLKFKFNKIRLLLIVCAVLSVVSQYIVILVSQFCFVHKDNDYK